MEISVLFKSFLKKKEEKYVEIRKTTGSFNYVTVKLSTETYLKGYMIMTGEENKFIWQEFFVEPSDKLVSFFIDDKNYDTIKSIIKIRFYNLENKMGNFEIEKIFVYNQKRFDDKKYIESSNLCAGFDSSKGPVISFLSSCKYKIEENKQNKILTFTKDSKVNGKSNYNLINTYDNGRFIQQSFHGTVASPYQANIYMETVWPFNPVQTGDSYGNKSKIVDYKFDKNYAYFKIRPLDWSKNNQLLDCYMEVEYIIFDKYIKIKNKFIDFSLMNNGDLSTVSSQEMPSFHTVYQLKKYVYPLPNRKKYITDDEGFWGDDYSNKQSFNNTTFCWSAWVNDSNFGVGLFTPNTNTHLKGKFICEEKYTTSDKANSVNHIAAVKNYNLLSLVPIKYNFYVSLGTLSEIGKAFSSINTKI